MISPDELTALRREIADLLGLAVAGGAPFSLLERLAAARGLLDALAEVPNHGLEPAVVDRARRALESARTWQRQSSRRVAA